MTSSLTTGDLTLHKGTELEAAFGSISKSACVIAHMSQLEWVQERADAFGAAGKCCGKCESSRDRVCGICESCSELSTFEPTSPVRTSSTCWSSQVCGESGQRDGEGVHDAVPEDH